MWNPLFPDGICEVMAFVWVAPRLQTDGAVKGYLQVNYLKLRNGRKSRIFPFSRQS